MKRDDVILVRGGGDLATGTIHRLWSAGLKVLVLEAEQPAAIRRQVSVSEAVYEGGAIVEGMRAALVKTLDEAVVVWHRGDVPVMVDPKGELIPQVRPAALVDAILAKKNLGTTRDMAPLTHRARPGFYRRCGCRFRGGDQARPPSGPYHPGGCGHPPTRASPESSAAMVLSVSSTQKRLVSSGMCVPSEILCRRVKRSRKSKRRTASALR